MVNGEPITPSSVEEVLRELERLLNAKTGIKAGFSETATALAIEDDSATLCRLKLIYDPNDARAMVVLLDLLESLKFEPVVFPNFDELGDRVSGYRCDLWGVDWHTEHEGKTRSEAVARAVLAVLQQEREG